MKIIHERESKTKKTERNRGVMQAIVKVWELNDFVVYLSFLQYILISSLIFKSNLELVLSIILKDGELYKSMLRWSVMFKNMRLVILFDMFLNPCFKMTNFTNVARASTSKFIY